MKKNFFGMDGALRSGWSILIVLIISIVLSSVANSIMIQIALRIANIQSANPMDSFNFVLKSNQWFYYSNMAISQIIIAIATIITIKFILKKQLNDFGLTSIRKQSNQIIIGVILGAAAISLVVFCLTIFGNARLTNGLLNPHFSISTILGLVTFIVVAFAEELFSRGYCITVLSKGMKPISALIISQIIFTILHAINPGITVIGVLNIFYIGMLFGYMYIKTGNLWMPMGFHLAWNYFQGNVFGFEVSGTTAHGLYGVELLGDSFITGGAFGAEGSIITTIICTLCFLFVWKYGSKKDTNFLQS